ncbi:MAG: glycosyltransferase [Anaerolineales bacterium]
MRILYFSKNYTPHDYRFLFSLSQTKHEVYFLQLEATTRQTEDRPVPENVQQILWAGGRSEFRWRDVPRLTFALRRIIKEIKPVLIHAGPIQNCAFLVALSGFRHLLAMSWGYDLVMEAEKSAWLRWVTSYTLRRSAFFTSDAKVSRDKAVSFGMNPEKTVIFRGGLIWITSIRGRGKKKKQATGSKKKLSVNSKQSKEITLFCSRTWEAIYGVDVWRRHLLEWQ